MNEGYIYAKVDRGIGDLLRKRAQLVQHRTTHLWNIQTIVGRSTSVRLSANKLNNERKKSYAGIWRMRLFLYEAKSNWLMAQQLQSQIKKIKAPVNCSRVDGIGMILALTIILETGEISRFPAAGNYASYCRCADSQRQSNGKKKGENNRRMEINICVRHA